MQPSKYISFIEKITRKLADAFLEVNQLCIQELINIEAKNNYLQKIDQNDVPVQPLIQLPQEAENNEESQEVEEIQKEIKVTKNKKIKKQGHIQDQKQGQESRNKKKSKKLSHKPKAPASSFLIFFKEQQGNIARMYPTYGVTQLTKVAAKCWNELSGEQKQPYIKLGDEQRKLYQVKMQQYRIQFPHEIAEKQKIRKQIKREKDKQKKSNKQSQTPKKQKQKTQLSQKAQPQNIQIKSNNRKTQQQPHPILIQSKQSQSDDDLQLEDDSLGMV